MSKEAGITPPAGGQITVFQTEDGKLKIDARLKARWSGSCSGSWRRCFKMAWRMQDFPIPRIDLQHEWMGVVWRKIVAAVCGVAVEPEPRAAALPTGKPIAPAADSTPNFKRQSLASMGFRRCFSMIANRDRETTNLTTL